MSDVPGQPPAGGDGAAEAAAAEKVARDKACNEEFDWYEALRANVEKGELENEKNYDTALMAIATLAIGASFNLFKDVQMTSSSMALLTIAWIGLGFCIFIALSDRFLSYTTHKKWRDILDDEFTNWEKNGGPGARKRVLPKYDTIRGVKALFHLKIASLVMLLIGVLFLLMFVGTAEQRKSPPPAPQPISVNVYNPPTTQQAVVKTTP